MKSEVLLRVAAVLALAQGLAHGSIILWRSPGSGEEAAVITMMKAHGFGPGGGRSYWDYYVGYAMFAALTCLLEAGLFWMLGRLGRQGAAIRPVLALFVIGNLGYAALVTRFFSLRLPIIFDLAVALCLGLAWLWV